MPSLDTDRHVRPKFAGQVPTFKVGQIYHRRDEIHALYGGNWQSGISVSRDAPAIFLFTGESGEQYGYRDGYDDAGVFSYTGEGQVGNMVFKAGNKAVRDHSLTGRALHLFQSLGKGKPQKYLGEFVLANYSIRRGLDREGNERDVIVFHLMSAAAEPAAAEQVALELVDHTVSDEPESSSLEEARQRALVACEGRAGGAGTTAVRTLYERSKAVRDYVLLRARGTCEGCSSPAPFTDKQGAPYLEVHHTIRLSDGGLDHPRHVAALCPTCHRRIHFGQDGVSLNESVIQRVQSIED